MVSAAVLMKLQSLFEFGQSIFVKVFSVEVDVTSFLTPSNQVNSNELFFASNALKHALAQVLKAIKVDDG
jgi:hypothetical protein